jgi:hypothetical protein
MYMYVVYHRVSSVYIIHSRSLLPPSSLSLSRCVRGMCIPIRFYGSTLAILGAHLPADGHRKGHECNVTRRCEALRDLLATRSFDAHLQCMHTILLGTLVGRRLARGAFGSCCDLESNSVPALSS